MLIEDLGIDRINAMKEKDALRKDLLSTLIGEASKESKLPSDEVVIATIKKFIKNIEITLNHLKKLKVPDYIAENKCNNEIGILKSYLPVQLNERDIRLILEQPDVGSNMGSIMKYFKTHFDGQYDGAMLSKIVKEVL